ASASIQLDLRSNLPPSKLTAIVHLVANAVEGLESSQVTVVDTKGRLIFKGENNDDAASILSNSQLEYKKSVENEIRQNVQSMLEGIVGAGKAIVRVYAEIDFNKTTLNQEEYDPAAKAVRSERNIQETAKSGDGTAGISQETTDQRRGVVQAAGDANKQMIKQDIATNYEINRTTKTILKPAGKVQRLSIAAAIDGIYKLERLNDGTVKRNYIPRTADELKKFEEIVKKAMGYNEDREDQISVSSISFSDATPMMDVVVKEENTLTTALKLAENHKRTIVNFLLVAFIFFIVVRPLLKSMKNIAQKVAVERKVLVPETGEYPQITQAKSINQKELIAKITKTNHEKAQQLINGWISEQE
ncbi:MAG: flagellar M-ring protein FliF, partial [Proteobacteria bacterium]|nr:flagellar M-ring protein FliF [Pseudomonadota bacterium]